MSAIESDRKERLARAWELFHSEAYAEAEALFLDLVREVEAQLGEDAPELIKPLYGYAGSISKQQPWNVFPPLEEEALARALRLAVQLHGEESSRTVELRETLADSLWAANRTALAAEHMEIVVRIKERARGEGIIVAHALNGLAGMYADLGRHAEAVSISERAFAMAGDRGNDAADFEMLFARGRSLVALGRYTDAIPLLERALAWYLGKYGERNRGTVELRDWLERAREGQQTEPPK